MSGWMYALACVVGPAAWGIVMYWVFNAFGRRQTPPDRQSRPPVDYSI